MAKVKYSTGITPLRNEHHGFTFQSSRSGNSMMKSQANDRARNINQINKQVNILKAVRGWRQMSQGNKLAWTNFATTYPQPCRKDPTKFLSGYQLFLKRNHYLFLNEGIEEPFMEAPLMNALSLTTINFSVSQMDNCADVTEAYLKNFGMLPTPGDIILFQCLPMAVDTGQFFTPIKQQLSVTATYFDGMFLSFILPPALEHIVFSIYLSKPINQSVNYTGTKVRYMGCFTTKSFLSLTDTPSSYTGAAGKVATVNPGETGLIFSTPSSGGLTCADLVNCPKIVSMDLKDSNIINSLVNQGISSYPHVLWGALYNWYAVNDGRKIAPVSWHIPTFAEFQTLATYLGGLSVCGSKMKDFGAKFWSINNIGGTNQSGFSARAAGSRATAGIYSPIYTHCMIWSSTNYDATKARYSQLQDSDPSLWQATQDKHYGYSVRCVRDNINSMSCIGNDGTQYRTLKLGSQIWMMDHLNETLFQNLEPIPNVIASVDWAALTTAGMCWNPLTF